MNLLKETAKNETDCRIKFRRITDNSVYCVMSPETVERYKKAGTLNMFLKNQRDTGIVIRTFKD